MAALQDAPHNRLAARCGRWDQRRLAGSYGPRAGLHAGLVCVPLVGTPPLVGAH